MNKNNYVAIMAGGVGSRFWPASRTAKPKQFLDILGVGKSLLQLTYDRFLKICPKENIFIVTNAIYRDLVKLHLPNLTNNQILGEPSRNNTAPCVAYTAFKLQQLNPKANFILAPADHIILDEANFVQTLTMALEFTASHEAIVTLGIRPTRPDTGYGYINFSKRDANNDGIFKVKQFTEKPDSITAQAFLESGDYLWNAGIFVSSTKMMLKSFKMYANEIYDILAAGEAVYNTPQEQPFIDKYYPTTPNISIDYAIAEKSDKVYTIPSDFGWSDLGTWGSLHVEAEKDNENNVLNIGNHHILDSVSDCLIRVPKNKLLVIKDLKDYIVIDEDDVLLIYPKSKEQEIKKITQLVEKLDDGDIFL